MDGIHTNKVRSDKEKIETFKWMEDDLIRFHSRKQGRLISRKEIRRLTYTSYLDYYMTPLSLILPHFEDYEADYWKTIYEHKDL